MDIVIAGAHGKIASSLARLLVARGDRVRGLIRNPDHADDLRGDGSEPVLLDLEAAEPDQVAEAVAGADAVVFAAGAGPGSGPERKLTVDRDGAIKLLDAARTADVPRYVIISSVGAEDPPGDDDVFSVYLRAKAEPTARSRQATAPGRSCDPASLPTTPARGGYASRPIRFATKSRATTWRVSWPPCSPSRARRA